MKFFHILQLNVSKYVVLDEDFKRQDATGKEPVDAAKKDRVILTLGQVILFIKKNKGMYTTYLKFNVPQLRSVLEQHDVAKKINNDAKSTKPSR
jgi:hypothetical protein